MSEKIDRVIVVSNTSPGGLAEAINRMIGPVQAIQPPAEVVSVSFQALPALTLSQAGTPEYSALLHLRGERFPDTL